MLNIGYISTNGMTKQYPEGIVESCGRVYLLTTDDNKKPAVVSFAVADCGKEFSLEGQI